MKNNFFKYCLNAGLIFLLVIFIQNSVSGTVYYVSNAGDDSNSGLTASDPWKSLDKVNQTFLRPGDKVLFKRGGKWHGTIKIFFPGKTDNPVTYGAYGSGENPVISGFSLLSDWTEEGNGIFSCELNPESALDLVVINDKPMQMGRFPNDKNLSYESAYLNISITDKELASSPNWSGAEVVIYKDSYSIDRCIITNHTGNTLRYTSLGSSRNANAGLEYFIQNDIKTLDKFGEWYFNRLSRKLYVFFGDINPETVNVKAPVIDYLVTNKSRDYITISSLTFEGSNSSSVLFYEGTDNCIFKDCEVKFSGYDGFTLSGNNIHVDNCSFLYTNGGGIVVNGRNALITNNELTDIGVIPGQTNMLVSSCAMTVNGNYPIVKFNHLDSTGYMGIYFTVSAETGLIQFNKLEHTCQLVSDAGSIYLGHDHYGTLVDHNIILNSGANGIYLDEQCKGVIVSNNTIISSKYNGIKLHKSSNDTILNNIIYHNRTGLNFSNWEAVQTLFDNHIDKNIVFARSEDFVIRYVNLYTGNNRIGSFTNNFYAKTNEGLEKFSQITTKNSNFEKNFAEWQSYTGQDSNSKFVSIKSSQGESSELFYNATESSVKYFLGSQTFRDVYGNVITDSFELKPFESLVLIGKNFEMVNRKPQISEQSFNFYLPKFENDSLGQVFASDPDTDQTLFFKITGGNEQGLFRIDSLTGILYAATDINLTGKNEFQLIVAVEDNSVNPQMQQAVLTIHIEGSDSSPPVITFFSIPPRAFTLKVPIENLLTSDDAAVAGYLLSQTENLPSVDDTSWTPIPPTFFSFVSQGSNVLYAFVKDTAGNISLPVFDTVFIALPDLSPKYSEYLFEEPEGAEIIDSNNNNNGTIVYEAERIFGITGQAMSFTGLGFIFIGPAYGENVKNEVTLSAWIKPKQSADLGYQGIIMHGGPEIDSYALYINPGIRSIGFQTRGTSSAWLVLENVDELWDGNWHHIAAVYDGSEKRIYLDGKALITVPAEGEIDSGFGYNLLIGAGRDEATPSLLYKGDMDNVRIYNYAIDENEVTELFDSVNRHLSKVEVSENVSICEGEDYWGLTETGEYIRTLQRKAPGTSQADSVVTTYLQVNPVFSETEEITIKEGENYKGWTETGIYEEKYSSVLGCDSIFIIDLTVIPAIYTVEDVTICEGESYLGYNEPGQYQRIFPASTGGDSIVITNLSVNPVYSTTENVSILYGDNYNGWTESGQYTRNLTSMFMCDSMVITNLIVTEPLIQEIELKTGWNIFSGYIQPIELLFDDLLNPLRSQNLLIEVKDERENSYHRKNGEWVNNIGNWLKTEGYKIKVNADCILKLTGVPVSLPLNIPVKKGWNIISFPYNGKVDALNVVEPLINAGVLKKIQDERGNAIEYWGDNLGWINAIGNFEAGEGYIVQVTGEADLPILISFDKSNELVSENPKPVHFKPVFSGNGFSHMNINITGLYKSGLEPGDEIGAFDGENCVGVFKLTESNIAQNIVSINASATDADSLNGFIENNPVLLKLWKENQGKEFGVQYEVLNGEMVFRNYGSVFLDLLKIFEINPGDGELPQVKIYPNPVSRDFTVEFSKMPENNTNIVFSDLAGKIIATRLVTSEKENFYMAALPPGIYLVKVALPQITYIKKIVVR